MRAPPLLVVCLALAACGARDVPAFSSDPEGVHQRWLVAVRAPAAWSVERGGPESVIAVLDNGVDATHPDLAGALWQNPGERPNGLDDDGDGIVDDLVGADLRARTGDVSLARIAGVSDELYGHATAIVGIVAARTDNGVGVAGACPGCRVMVLRARDFSARRTVVDVLDDAVTYAASHGARVLSVSDGARGVDLTDVQRAAMASAMAHADALGVLVVASAGNDAGGPVRWPAAIASVLAVAAVDDDDRAATFTSRGPEVDVSAPGVALHTTLPGGTYGPFSGTSASAPVVAALAGLLFARHPTWTPSQVAARIRDTARPTGQSGLGAGVVDFLRAVSD